MQKFIVEGSSNLSGSILPAGNKNEALPVLVAALLTDKPIKILNIPIILDVLTMIKILKHLNIDILKLDETNYQITSAKIKNSELPFELCQNIRASFLLLAPLLHRFGSVEIPQPGGDIIGKRRLDSHFLALKKMGIECKVKKRSYFLKAKKIKGATILLDEASVMATENLVMIACLAEGITTIYNAACEPHVQGLCKMLNKMGAKIEGVGSNFLTITGVSSLQTAEHKIGPDYIEIGSFISLAAVLNSKIKIIDGYSTDLGMILPNFAKLGIVPIIEGNDLVITKNQKLKILYDDRNYIPKIDDAPWPGFPADLISIMIVTASQCYGNLLIFEKLFESRLFWVDKLISMGAQIVLCDPHRALISGPTKLTGGVVTSPDIRAGMALLIAALCAKGNSEIFNITQIDRGYQNIDLRLNKLGAKIKRISN